MKKRLLLVLMTLLTTSAMWADVYQDPVSNVKYGYGGDYGDEATVIDGSEASGDIVILDKISVDGVEYPVTSIGKEAFKDCADLTSVTANSVITIADWAFSGCSSLKSIEMDNLEDQGGDSFLGTPWWKNQPDGLVCLGKMALGYKGTATGDFTLDIPENISFMNDFCFDSKRNLTSLTINIAGSLTAKYSFSSLGWNLKTVTVNGNLVAAEGCFNDCYAEILNINSPTVPQEIMRFNQNLKEVHFGDNVMEISMSAFEYCTGLTEIVIPTNVKTIEAGAFSDCSNLKTLTIGGETEVSSSFRDCPVETLIVNGQSIRSRFGFVRSLDLSSPIELIISKDVMEIDERAFSRDENIESVTILSDDLKIGGNAFDGCKKLTSISFEGSSVEFEEGSIGTLSALTDIHFGDNVTTIKEGDDYYCAFDRCNALTNVTGGDNITYIGGSYSGIFPKTSVWFTSQPDGMIYIGKVAYSYKGDMPEGTHYVIEDGTTAICGYAFYGCTGLSSVSIPATVTSIGDYAFSGCNQLTDLPLGENIQDVGSGAFPEDSPWFTSWYASQPDGMIYIGNVAFRYKGEMAEGTHFVLEDGTMKILAGAFKGCENMTAITLPATLTTNDGAFWDYDNLDIYSYTDNPLPLSVNGYTEWGGSFECDFSYLTLYVPAGTKEIYQNTEGWCYFAKIVEMNYISVTLDKEMITFTSDQLLDFSKPIDGLEVYTVSEVNSKGQAVLKKVTTVVPASIGLILKGTEGETYEIPAFATEEPAAPSNLLVGVTEDTTIGGNNLDYILKDGRFVKALTGTLSGGKAYLRLDTALGREAIDILGTPTSISEVATEKNNEQKVYNLSGQRVSKPQQKGVYIMNGKKVIKK